MLVCSDPALSDVLLSSEETLEDVRVRMVGIQENEVVQLRELTNFLDLEITYVRSYLDELMKVRADWVDECVMCHLFDVLMLTKAQGDAEEVRSAQSETSAASDARVPRWVDPLDKIRQGQEGVRSRRG